MVLLRFRCNQEEKTVLKLMVNHHKQSEHEYINLDDEIVPTQDTNEDPGERDIGNNNGEEVELRSKRQKTSKFHKKNTIKLSSSQHYNPPLSPMAMAATLQKYVTKIFSSIIQTVLSSSALTDKTTKTKSPEIIPYAYQWKTKLVLYRVKHSFAYPNNVFPGRYDQDQLLNEVLWKLDDEIIRYHSRHLLYKI
ncbi:hypothetical protein Tco_1562201 [Tanacetum coccineum]